MNRNCLSVTNHNANFGLESLVEKNLCS